MERSSSRGERQTVRSFFLSLWLYPSSLRPHKGAFSSTFIFLFKITSDVELFMFKCFQCVLALDLHVCVYVRACVVTVVIIFYFPAVNKEKNFLGLLSRSEETQEQEVMASENSLSMTCTCLLFLGLFLQILAS